ncbi:preprotein translocase subunit SecG [Candidatus Latescibacterota bacterium]
MIYGILIFIHVIASVSLIIAVLLQSSKGGGLAGTFGGSGITGGIFGGRGAAPFLVKATTFLAILFMITSISLSFIRSGGTPESVLRRSVMESGRIGSEPAVTDEMPLSPIPAEGEQDSGNSPGNVEGEASQ